MEEGDLRRVGSEAKTIMTGEKYMASGGTLLSFRYNPDWPDTSFLTERQLEETKDLFTDGNWGIREYPYPREWASLMVHRCPGRKAVPSRFGDNALEWRLPLAAIKGYNECDTCHETVPDGLYALWKLQNMDSIQIAVERYPT